MISSRVRKQAVHVLLASSKVQMPMQGEETELVATSNSYLMFIMGGVNSDGFTGFRLSVDHSYLTMFLSVIR